MMKTLIQTYCLQAPKPTDPLGAWLLEWYANYIAEQKKTPGVDDALGAYNDYIRNKITIALDEMDEDEYLNYAMKIHGTIDKSEVAENELRDHLWTDIGVYEDVVYKITREFKYALIVDDDNEGLVYDYDLAVPYEDELIVGPQRVLISFRQFDGKSYYREEQ